MEAGSEGGDFMYYSCKKKKKISFLNTLLDQGIGETDLFLVSSSETLCKSLFMKNVQVYREKTKPAGSVEEH